MDIINKTKVIKIINAGGISYTDYSVAMRQMDEFIKKFRESITKDITQANTLRYITDNLLSTCIEKDQLTIVKYSKFGIGFLTIPHKSAIELHNALWVL